MDAGKSPSNDSEAMLNTTFTSESFTGISMCSSFSVVDIPLSPEFLSRYFTQSHVRQCYGLGYTAVLEIAFNRSAILVTVSSALATPCRCAIHSGWLYESHVVFAASCQTRIFNGRSIPTVWADCIKGVPPRAFPKMMSLVGGNVSPASAAPAA